MYSSHPSFSGLGAHLKKLIKFALVYLSCLVVPCASQVVQKHDQVPSEAERPASDARSFMELFTKIERDWTQALQKKDRTALDAILAPEFIFLNTENPEKPVSRGDWIHSELANCDIHSFSHRAMSIRSYMGVAVVSFIEKRQGTINGKDCSGEYFIVDDWEANHGKWQASARYITLINNHLGQELKPAELTLRQRAVSVRKWQIT
jgi:hypothetical protein